MSNSESMENLTAFQRDILYVVAGMDEPHGLGIKTKLDEYYEQPINHGRLYPNLDSLTDAGLLTKGKHDERTNCYTLTEAGQQTLERRREWETEYVETNQSRDVLRTAD